jgi:hypothetical protein
MVWSNSHRNIRITLIDSRWNQLSLNHPHVSQLDVNRSSTQLSEMQSHATFQLDGTPSRRKSMIESLMRAVRVAQKHLQVLMLVTFIGAALVAPAASVAQNLGTAPATGQAVQGQTASQPEGAFLNLVNWVCNVICPVGAGIAVVATVLQWRSGRSWLPSAMTAGGLICVSGILRLIEYFISQGQAVG